MVLNWLRGWGKHMCTCRLPLPGGSMPALPCLLGRAAAARRPLVFSQHIIERGKEAAAPPLRGSRPAPLEAVKP